ncbi:OB-fold domain-containing protein [Arthrobacter sp. MYb213]|uniref:Zn-ribbon domain-containing OB-fold protein n=1 Tax=Arthrobacter sp. MYb213 TaxID=1848595 RepID=UPI000CFD48E0|nr:OB-fold domain-containing protein [Arthrobacter sp. MYb213]PRB70408.1 acyl dehydratase [Arthrobacter sp. MYb213]
MSTYALPKLSRPLPVPTPLTRPFWDALAERKVRIQYSPSLDEYIFYPRPLAPRTLADDLQWREISGNGTLYSYTVATRPPAPHFAAEGEMILAIVQWDEGPKFSTEIVNVKPENLHLGMELSPVFTDYPEGNITMLRYEPRSGV